MQASNFLSQLQLSFSGKLPGWEAHLKMAPSSRVVKPLTPQQRESYRPSAVAIVCFPENDSVKFILLQRPHYEGYHSAQMSFPGGKWESSDANLDETARRETKEEIGVDLLPKHLLGELSEMYIPVSGFTIAPFVYYLDEKPTIIPDPREVESVHCIAFEDLLSEEIVKTTEMTIVEGFKKRMVPYYELHDKIVWGATAIILSELKDMLLKQN